VYVFEASELELALPELLVVDALDAGLPPQAARAVIAVNPRTRAHEVFFKDVFMFPPFISKQKASLNVLIIERIQRLSIFFSSRKKPRISHLKGFFAPKRKKRKPQAGESENHENAYILQ